ncbi:hypothetical protein PAHAL_1G016400 [Panicum hallii]|uniref:Uncharacterized protein n=1 Tax=Panicum hallii TaxID=206008 RepID=A0A2S3GKT0_9POAL|nr:uncharacterized abhydrolase domain-containing protein DDB_G0269086-like isoform X1 [Panicum hallii]PAN03707.1 hypothetical protein PAHAL_1G016400 [Panicum hallii]
MAAAKEEEFTDAELEVAAILCDLKKTLRARDRRRRRRMQRLQAAPEIPSWGRRRPRSMPEEKPATPAPVPASGVAEKDGAASPDTPLAYPESGGDDAPMEEDDAKKPTSNEQWVQQQHGVVASLSQENAHLLMQIEEYRARLQSSRSTNESLKQLHKVKREEEEEQARKRPRVAAQAPGAADPRAAAAAALGLDLNEPARAPEEDEKARAQAQAAAVAAAAAAEWYRHARVRAAMEKAAVSAGARRRRLEILRAKVACPLVSSRPRRAG